MHLSFHFDFVSSKLFGTCHMAASLLTTSFLAWPLCCKISHVCNFVHVYVFPKMAHIEAGQQTCHTFLHLLQTRSLCLAASLCQTFLVELARYSCKRQVSLAQQHLCSQHHSAKTFLHETSSCYSVTSVPAGSLCQTFLQLWQLARTPSKMPPVACWQLSGLGLSCSRYTLT